MNLVNSIDFSDPDKIAIIFAGDAPEYLDVTWTYGELRQRMESVRHLLDIKQVPMGATVGIAARNHPIHIAAFLGVLAAGRVACSLNTKLRFDAGRKAADKVGLSFAFADAECFDHVPLGVPAVTLDEIPASGARNEPFVDVLGDAPACILFTSGSTSAPKAVRITHGGYRWALTSYDFLGESEGAESEQSRALVVAPLFHMNAQYCTLLYLHFGGAIVLMRQFNPADYLRAVESHQVTEITGVPSMIAMADQARKPGKSFPSVRYVSNGSAPLTSSIEASIREMFPNAVYDNGYGTTETGPVSFGPHPDGIARPPGSLGYPMADVMLRLDGNENGGVLWLKTPMTCSGYLDQDFRGDKFVDGWYRTGDVVRRDDKGFFYFVGREDDLIVTGGEKVIPSEIEEVLESHEAVKNAAVVALEDALRGQVPVAFVVLKNPTLAVNEKELQDYIVRVVPSFSCPKHIFFMDEIPLTSLGKVSKVVLREIAAARMESFTDGSKR
jgi:acyl-coenzyme A synthetase/AMP-(fatty) acid ligase